MSFLQKRHCLLAFLAASVTDVTRPPTTAHSQTSIDSRRAHNSWSCNIGRCTTVSTSRDVIQQCCSRVHRPNVKAARIVLHVTRQTLFPPEPVIFHHHHAGGRPATLPRTARHSSQTRQHHQACHTTITSPKSRRDCSGGSSGPLSALSPVAFTAVYEILKTAEIENARVTLFLVCRSVDRIL
jgi:hypothetical protein